MTTLRENVSGIVFVVGFAVFVGGVASYSGPLAAVVAGGILMLAAAYPYLRPKGKG